MAVTQGNIEINNLAVRLTEQLAQGGAARASLGDKSVAFAWTSGLPRGLWSYCATATVQGGSFSAVRTALSATPPALVAEGGVKPTAVDVSVVPVSLRKYAGLASFSLEASAYADALPRAVAQTLVGGSLLALESDAIAAVLAAAGASITAPTDWTSAILEGIGVVAGNGGNPNLLVMSPADFAAAVDGPQQLQFSGADAIPTYLGLSLHLSPKIVAGTAIVADRASILIAESSESPSIVVDPFSAAETNQTRIVCDVMAATFVGGPGAVAKLTPTLAPLDVTFTPPVGRKSAR